VSVNGKFGNSPTRIPPKLELEIPRVPLISDPGIPENCIVSLTGSILVIPLIEAVTSAKVLLDRVIVDTNALSSFLQDKKLKIKKEIK
jgi:hypothetical protein